VFDKSDGEAGLENIREDDKKIRNREMDSKKSGFFIMTPLLES
jgi:hypothetical protein